MCCLNDGLFLKLQLGFFSALVFKLTVIVLLADSYRGQSLGVGPSQIIVTLVGEDVVLPCHLEPAVDAVSKTLEWGRTDLEPRFVHVWHEGQNLLANQNPSYTGRTSVSIEKLKRGDLSLKLSAVKLSDNGTYRCYIPSQDKKSAVELLVGSVSSPVMTYINVTSSSVVLQCESKGWYPEPEVFWLDGEGNLVPAGPPETVRGPDELYTVSSRVTVEKRHSNNFTCRVQQSNIKQTRETHIQISADCFEVTSSSAARLSIIIITLLIIILAVAFVVWKWRQNQIRDTEIHHEGGTEEIERHHLMAEKENITKKKTEAEQKNSEQAFHILKEKKEELENLREQLRHQRENMEETIKETENKIQSVEKMAESDRYNEMKGITLTAKQQLRDRKEMAEKLEMFMTTLLNKTNGMLNKMEDGKEGSRDPQKENSEQLEEVQTEQKQES